MRQHSIYISFGLHVLFLIGTLISLPFLKRDFVIPPPISIELAPLDKVTQTNKVAPQPTPKEEKEENKPPAPPKSAPKNDNDKPTPVKPVETVPEKDAIPDKKKKVEKKEEKKPAEEKKDFSSLLKNLADEKKPAPPLDKPDLKADEGAAEGQNAPIGEKLTMSEEDALRHQLAQCWSVPAGAKDADKISVDIYMVINKDRTLQSAKIIDQARANSDSAYRTLAESALRAVYNPSCSPFLVPPDKYDVWKTTTVTFNASQML